MHKASNISSSGTKYDVKIQMRRFALKIEVRIALRRESLRTSGPLAINWVTPLESDFSACLVVEWSLRQIRGGSVCIPNFFHQ